MGRMKKTVTTRGVIVRMGDGERHVLDVKAVIPEDESAAWYEACRQGRKVRISVEFEERAAGT